MSNPSTDEKLMSRFVWHNDRDSYEELVFRWDRRLFSFLVKATGDVEVAKDSTHYLLTLKLLSELPFERIHESLHRGGLFQ